MKQIYIEPDEVYDYFLEMYGQESEVIIAENSTSGVEISLVFNQDGPAIAVYADDDEVHYKEIIDYNEAEKVVERIYFDWLEEDVPELLAACHEIEENFEQKVNDREEELDILVMDFITEVTQEYSDIINDECVIGDLKEHFLMYMYRKHGISPYRPMKLKDNKGNEVMEDYPYELLCS